MSLTSPRIEQVDLWVQRTDRLTEREHAEAIELLSAAERERWHRHVHERQRREFAFAHALARRALSARTDRPPDSWQFREGPEGKPYIDFPECDLRFNIAHTDGLAACAIAPHGDVGVDAETIDRVADPMDIATRHFSEREIADLLETGAGEQRTRFIELWTLKEAWLKAVGTGLRAPLGNFAFEWVDRSGLRFVPPAGTDSTEWRFFLLAPTDRHRVALAVRGNAPVRLRTREPSSPAGPDLPVLRTSVPG